MSLKSRRGSEEKTTAGKFLLILMYSADGLISCETAHFSSNQSLCLFSGSQWAQSFIAWR